jgi:hypothetical protein
MMMRVSLLVCLWIGNVSGSLAQTFPPTDDIPEEVLQTQVLETATSSQDGQSLAPSQYTREQQQQQIASEDVPPRLIPEVKQVVDLLRIRKLLKGILPFL